MSISQLPALVKVDIYESALVDYLDCDFISQCMYFIAYYLFITELQPEYTRFARPNTGWILQCNREPQIEPTICPNGPGRRKGNKIDLLHFIQSPNYRNKPVSDINKALLHHIP